MQKVHALLRHSLRSESGLEVRLHAIEDDNTLRTKEQVPCSKFAHCARRVAVAVNVLHAHGHIGASCAQRIGGGASQWDSGTL